MAGRHAKRSSRRKQLSDEHVVVHDEEDRIRDVPSAYQARIEGMEYIELEGDPTVLAMNLRRLVQQKGVTRKQVWTGIGEKKRAWLERLLKRGLSRITPRSRERLKKVAAFFNVTYDDLWDTNLITFEVGKPREAFQDYTEKLADLLASGKHDYLKGLIDSLHANLWKNKVKPVPLEEEEGAIPPPFQRAWRPENT